MIGVMPGSGLIPGTLGLVLPGTCGGLLSGTCGGLLSGTCGGLLLGTLGLLGLVCAERTESAATQVAIMPRYFACFI